MFIQNKHVRADLGAVIKNLDGRQFGTIGDVQSLALVIWFGPLSEGLTNRRTYCLFDVLTNRPTGRLFDGLTNRWASVPRVEQASIRVMISSDHLALLPVGSRFFPTQVDLNRPTPSLCGLEV